MNNIDQFIWDLIEFSQTDNGEAALILIQDSHCDVNQEMLDVMLTNDFNSMAEALQHDKHVWDAIQRQCVQHALSISEVMHYCQKLDDCNNWPHASVKILSWLHVH